MHRHSLVMDTLIAQPTLVKNLHYLLLVYSSLAVSKLEALKYKITAFQNKPKHFIEAKFLG